MKAVIIFILLGILYNACWCMDIPEAVHSQINGDGGVSGLINAGDEEGWRFRQSLDFKFLPRTGVN